MKTNKNNLANRNLACILFQIIIKNNCYRWFCMRLIYISVNSTKNINLHMYNNLLVTFLRKFSYKVMLHVWLRSLHLVSSKSDFSNYYYLLVFQSVNFKKIINRKYSPILETIAQHENYLKHVVSTRCQCWCITFRVNWVV